MDINVVKKQNAISIAGNVFQCVDTNPVITALYSGDNVSIFNNLTSRWVVKDAPYDTFKNEAGTALGTSASQVVSVINTYVQADNPEGVIKNTDTVRALDGVEQFTTEKSGQILIVGDTKNGSIAVSNYTTNAFYKSGDDINVGDVTATTISTSGVGSGITVGTGGTISSVGAITTSSFMRADSLYLEGATDNLYETHLVAEDPTQDNTITFPNTSGTVALVGSSSEIVIGAVDFDLANPPSLTDGRLAYDIDRETLVFQSVNGELAIGEIYKPVINSSGTNISAGSVVKAVGVTGERFQIQLFDPTADEELYLIGVTQSAINNGDEGIVVTQGIVKHIDTSLWAVGTVLYADATTPGGLKNTPPTSPNLAIPVAMVMKQDATNGTLFVRPTIYSHLNEIHDVSISSLSNNDLLKYNSSSGVWENSTIDTDEVAEGSVNLYWTQSRFNTAFTGGISGITSDDIADGTTTVIMTTGERSKLTGIEAGAEVNVNADWNAVSGDAQILNKPTIPTDFSDLSGNTDDVPEGQTNKYYTDTRVQTYLTSEKIRANYPTQTVTGNTALTATYEQTMVVGNSPTSITFQVASGLARDCEILVMQYGAGDITITGATGVTIRTTSDFYAITAGQYAIIGLKQIGTTDEYIVTGERKPA
jgi:hypothetical protein